MNNEQCEVDDDQTIPIELLRTINQLPDSELRAQLLADIRVDLMDRNQLVLFQKTVSLLDSSIETEYLLKCVFQRFIRHRHAELNTWYGQNQRQKNPTQAQQGISFFKRMVNWLPWNWGAKGLSGENQNKKSDDKKLSNNSYGKTVDNRGEETNKNQLIGPQKKFQSQQGNEAEDEEETQLLKEVEQQQKGQKQIKQGDEMEEEDEQKKEK